MLLAKLQALLLDKKIMHFDWLIAIVKLSCHSSLIIGQKNTQFDWFIMILPFLLTGPPRG